MSSPSPSRVVGCGRPDTRRWRPAAGRPARSGSTGCRRGTRTPEISASSHRAALDPARAEHQVGAPQRGRAAGAAAPAGASRRRPSRPGRRSCGSRPHSNPARYAAPSPSLPSRCSTCTFWSAAASSSASLPVPSGELSSAISTSASGTARAYPADDAGDVLRLVVGRDDHQDPTQCRDRRLAHTVSSTRFDVGVRPAGRAAAPAARHDSDDAAAQSQRRPGRAPARGPPATPE